MSLLFLVLLVACAPRLVHMDGQPLTPIAPLVSLGNGWLAIDSCEFGRHALIEIQVEAADSRARASDLARLALRIGARRGWKAGRVQMEEPVCWEKMLDGTGHQIVDRSRERWGFNPTAEPRCLYVVRAQFDLDRLPAAGDSITVLHGKRFVQVAWRK